MIAGNITFFATTVGYLVFGLFLLFFLAALIKYVLK